MHYDFIEIGTSDYDTLIDQADDYTTGLSVECVKYYLDRLPNKKKVKKINVAIGSDTAPGSVDVYYIPDTAIQQHNLPPHIRGCNQVGGYHPQHAEYKHLVSVDTVDKISISQLFQQHQVSSVGLLKLDTEGTDCDLLTHLLDYLVTQPNTTWPKKIIFESNELTPKAMVDATIQLYCHQGYRLYKQDANNTELVYDADTGQRVLPIVTHTDSRYLFGTKLLLQSILNSYTGIRLKFYVTHISTDLTQHEIDSFLKYFANESVDIYFVTSQDLEQFVAAGEFEDYNKKMSAYFAQANIDPALVPNSKCLCKMWICDAVPEDEVVFIDSDTFLFGNIQYIFEYQRQRPLAAAPDPWPIGYTMHGVPFENENTMDIDFFHTKHLKLDYAPYFNTGVFVTSLEYWRQHRFLDKTKAFMKDTVILYGDQDILNSLLEYNFDSLPLHYNAQWKSLEKDHGVIPYHLGRPYTPLVVHFNGQFKPMHGQWMYIVGDHPVLLAYHRLRRQVSIKQMYLDFLGREPDNEGLQSYVDGKMFLHEIENTIKNSEEAQQR